MDLQRVTTILGHHGGQFIRAWVFGSVARGEQDAESDVDIVLVRRTGASFFDRIREVMDLVGELGPVDLLIYTPEELSDLVESRKNGFLQDVIAKGVQVEGSQGRGAAMASLRRYVSRHSRSARKH